MNRRGLPILLTATVLVISSFLAIFTPGPSSAADDTDLASAVLIDWDGQNVIDLTERLCNISAEHPAYRVSGSDGANEAADFIKGQFLEYGLQAYEEGFDLPVWNLLSEPELYYDPDGNMSTTENTTVLGSFNAESYSMPTPAEGYFLDVVSLPLPLANSRESIGWRSIDNEAWDSVNTTGKVLLIGREVRWAISWEMEFKEKIESQTPAAIIFFNWYPWMSYANEYSQSSTGGRPLGGIGPMFWDLEIAVGSLNYSDGHALKGLVQNNSDARVMISIQSQITEGQHRNIIADIRSSGSSRYVVLGAHYDTVLCEGYVDNSASVATLLEIGRMVQSAKDSGDIELRYGLRLIAFAGEELGLAGSLNYVDAHRDELKDIVSVLVADCIGSQTFLVTDPPSTGSIDLGALVAKAAQGLNVQYDVSNLYGSDHSSFSHPLEAAQNYYPDWRTELDMQDVQGVASSMLFYSYPMTIYDEPAGPVNGNIHTPSDSISGVQGTGWISEDDLIDQAEVIALTTLYAVDISSPDQDWNWIYALPIAAVLLVGGYLKFYWKPRSRR